jgi:hypothetical protein
MQYCEQALAIHGFEPWNAFSNLSFVAAAAAAWRADPQRRRAVRAVAPLVLCVVAIACGSFAWHATHAPLAELADVLPILVFVVGFLHASLCQRPGMTPTGAVAWSGMLLVAVVATGMLAPRTLNGSAAYLPVLVALLGLALTESRRAARAMLLAAGVLFIVSLAARTLDLTVCAALPRGSHWLWHLCNGGVIFLALRTLLVASAHGGLRTARA